MSTANTTSEKKSLVDKVLHPGKHHESKERQTGATIGTSHEGGHVQDPNKLGKVENYVEDAEKQKNDDVRGGPPRQ